MSQSSNFGMRNFLNQTLANKPQFLDTIRLRGQEIRGPAKARQNSLLPGESDLIDQKSLFDADNTIAETDFFLTRLSEERPRNTMLEKMKKLTRVTSNSLNKSGGGSGGLSAYNQLMQRLTHAENKLKSVVEDAVAQESSYTMQALHLTIRVDACIQFNKESLPILKEQLQEVAVLETELEKWCRLINSMSRFQQEVAYLHESQNRYIPKLFLQTEEKDDAARIRKENADAETKLKKIMKMNGKVKRVAQYLTKTVGTRELNYSNLVYSNNVLLNMLDRQGYGPEEIRSQIWLKEIRKDNHAAHRRKSATTNLKPISAEEIVAAAAASSAADGEDDFLDPTVTGVPNELVVYDHCQCNDCAVVHSMVTECVMQLAAKTLQAEEGTRRLQRVLELQARMQDVKAIAEDFE